MTWTSPPADSADGPLTGADRPILEGYLAWQRSTLLNLCSGLTAAHLSARPVPSSTLSLLGLVRHMAKVERIWFRQRVAGLDVTKERAVGTVLDRALQRHADRPPALRRRVGGHGDRHRRVDHLDALRDRADLGLRAEQDDSDAALSGLRGAGGDFPRP